jgi:ABC-type multidrug transport system ATPase subunit
MSTIIKVTNLSKKFNDFTAVDDLSFSVEKGSIYGFLGQNGAGKSTTIRMLMTLIKPTNGTIEIFGKKLENNTTQILKNIGAVIERPDLYKYLSAHENVKIFAKLSGAKVTDKQIKEVLEKVGLQDWVKAKMTVFSQGMKQRLGIATALIHNPELIILDEPVNGLDPQGIADIRNLILHLKNDLNKTVLVSSHLLAEMEMIATDLLIINKGKKVIEGNMQALLNTNQVQLEIITNKESNKIKKIIADKNNNWIVKSIIDNTIVVCMEKSDVSNFNKLMVAQNIEIMSLRPKHSLEDYFLEQTDLHNGLLKKN